MTDQKFDENRLEIVKSYLENKEMLDIYDLNISILLDNKNKYNIYSSQKNGVKKFEYFINEIKLQELVKVLKLDTIKRIFIEDKLYRLRNKWIGKNQCNSADFENCK